MIETVGFSEIDDYASAVLKKHWPEVPNFGDINKLIWTLEAKEKKSLTPKTCKGQLNQQEMQSCCNVRGAEQISIDDHLKLKDQGSHAVQKNADINISEENLGQMHGEGNTCSAKTIRIGKAVLPQNEPNNTRETQGLQSGEGTSMQEIDIPAKNAGKNQKHEGCSTHTTSKAGKSFPNSDLKFQTELHYASHVTKIITKGVDIITAGVPCQPASVAGKRRGAEDDRWLWPEALRVVEITKPKWVIFENVGGFITLNDGVELDRVLSDLEAQGYTTRTFAVPACAVDAKHRRMRIWIVGHAEHDGSPDSAQSGGSAKTGNDQPERKNPSGEPAGTGEPGNSETLADTECSTSTTESEKQPECLKKDGAKVRIFDCPSGQTLANSTDAGTEGMRGRENAVDEDVSDASREHDDESGHGAGQVCGQRSEETEIQGRESGGNIRVAKSQVGLLADGLPGDMVRWSEEPEGIPRVAEGVKDRVQKLKGLGNAIVPQVAYQILKSICEIEKTRMMKTEEIELPGWYWVRRIRVPGIVAQGELDTVKIIENGDGSFYAEGFVDDPLFEIGYAWEKIEPPKTI